MKEQKKYQFLLSEKIGIVIFFLSVIGGLYILLKFSSKQRQTTKNISDLETVQIPDNLFGCTPEILAQDCGEIETASVCGYDYSIYENGSKEYHRLQFKSACYYCKFYGLEESNVGGTVI